ncbi:MAG: ERCC4 domain-containing protein [Candidatus ainarchaeum sp.]|nr:ERCC4 domain-containing protein [Candidatus ainarchaeum sp.]
MEGRVKVFADHREGRSRIAEILRGKGADVEIAQLSTGDFVVSDRCCVERKRREDFEASIVDARLFDQAQRLCESFGKPVLVVEGERFGERVSRPAVLGAISCLMLEFGISIFFTRDAEGTAEFILALAKREQLSCKRPVRVAAKRKALSLPRRQRMIVESLPSVGPKLARALLEEFGSVEGVITAGEEKLVKDEKIGEEKAKRIREALEAKYVDDGEAAEA